MFKRIFFFLIIFSLQVSFTKAQNTEYFYHIIERGQTVYAISKTYNIPIEAIYKLNATSKESITIGDSLKMPQTSGSYIYHTIKPKETLYSVSKLYAMSGEDIIEANQGLSEKTFTIDKNIRIPTNKVTMPMQGYSETKIQIYTDALLSQTKKTEYLNTVNVVLLLPFGINEDENPQKKRFIEYYEGFLLAIDKLKKENISINLYVHDIGKDTKKLKSILNKEETKQAQLIIGGFYDKQIAEISSFSHDYKIPYVIPFTSKFDESISNPYAFQVNNPQSILQSKVISLFVSSYKDKNIVFLIDKNGDKMDFVQTLQTELKQNKIEFKELEISTQLLSSIKNVLSKDKETVIVPSDASPQTLMRLMPTLKTLVQSEKDANISLFGYPEWQRYNQNYFDEYCILKTSIYTVFYADNKSDEVKMFSSKFRNAYSKNLMDTYPKYGLLGYDTGFFFIKGLSQFGSAFSDNTSKVKYKGIQTGFNFQRINNWSGFINTHYYLVNFNADYSISLDAHK